jgi:hypothetical protein
LVAAITSTGANPLATVYCAQREEKQMSAEEKAEGSEEAYEA